MKVKICGITNIEDARVAVAAGADFLGFICYSRSPRYVTPEEAGRIVAALRAEEAPVLTVGVFVNATRDEIERVMRIAGFDLAQLHGEEPPALVRAMEGRAFKALRPHAVERAEADAARYLPAAPEDDRLPQLLVDAYHPGAYGGTGQVGDWRIAQVLVSRCPRLLLAGGLTPDNVAAAIEQTRPWGVDVSSGVEARPRYKDHGRVWAFVMAARAAGGEL